MANSAAFVSESGLPVAPAPWTLHGRAWSFILSPLAKNASFPAGWAASHQADALAVDEFVGGLGQVMLVQYADSPVGPYDELAYTPGRFKHEDGLVASRVTRIYVSSKESAENGRRNWNVPKQVANFQYTEDSSSPGTWSLSVFPIQNLSPSAEPFFSVTIHPIPVITNLLRFRWNSNIVPERITTLVQPPLPKGAEPEEIASGVYTIEEPDTASNGKGKYAKIKPAMAGGIFFARVVPSLGGAVGDGVMFPCVKPWSVAMCMEGVEFEIPVSQWIEL